MDDLVEGRMPCATLLEAVRTLRLGRLHELLLLGRSLDAAEMVQWGLAGSMVESIEQVATVGKEMYTGDADGVYPRVSHIRARVRDMAQSDWPRSLEVIHQDMQTAGYGPCMDPAAASLFVESEGAVTVVTINRPNKVRRRPHPGR
jgi:enoyl-CoA hydratase/carnithine racemase